MKKRKKFCFIFVQVSSYISFSIAKWPQSTFCPLYRSNRGDGLLVTKGSVVEFCH